MAIPLSKIDRESNDKISTIEELASQDALKVYEILRIPLELVDFDASSNIIHRLVV